MPRLPGAALGALLMVALLTPGAAAQSSPDPSPIASATPLPRWPDAGVSGDGGTTPGVLDWQPVGPPFLQKGGVGWLTGWDGGFAALEARDDEEHSRSLTPAIWLSPDGRRWTRTRLPGGIRTSGIVAVLPFKGGLVITTDETDDLPGWGFDYAFWRSADGMTWRRAGDFSYRVPPALARRNCQANHKDVASVDGALMLYVDLCWDPCCGFAPPPGSQLWAIAGPRALMAAPPRLGTIAWRSNDAVTWRRTPTSGLHPTPRADYGILLRSWPEELLVARKSATPALARSNDGVSWVEVGPMPAGFHWYGQVELIPAADGVLVIGEDFDIESGYGNTLVAWRLESDGSDPITMVRDTAYTNGVIRDGDLVLLVGEAQGPGPSTVDEDDESWAWIMGSADGGRTWDQALSWTGSDGSCLSDAAQHERTVVVLSCTPGVLGAVVPPGSPALFVAPLPGSGPKP